MGSIVAFVSKKVGLEVLEFLLAKNYPLKAVVVASSEQKEFYKLLQNFKIKCIAFDEEKVIKLLESLRKVDWLVNAWSPHYLCEKILNFFTHRINIHPSYAPYCLGNDNAAWAIMENRSASFGQNLAGGGGILAGVCLLEMTKGIDEGAIWDTKQIVCEFGIKGKELHEILIKEAILFFKERFEDIFRGRVTPKSQKIITKYTRKQTESIKYLDANSFIKVEDLVLRVLANDFSPRYTAILNYQGREYSITLDIKAI